MVLDVFFASGGGLEGGSSLTGLLGDEGSSLVFLLVRLDFGDDLVGLSFLLFPFRRLAGSSLSACNVNKNSLVLSSVTQARLKSYQEVGLIHVRLGSSRSLLEDSSNSRLDVDAGDGSQTLTRGFTPKSVVFSDRLRVTVDSLRIECDDVNARQ